MHLRVKCMAQSISVQHAADMPRQIHTYLQLILRNGLEAAAAPSLPAQHAALIQECRILVQSQSE